MGISRDMMQGLISETEWEHRYAHALLRPANLYFLYEEKDLKSLSISVNLKFTPTGKKDPLVAKFTLTKLPGCVPPCWIYRLTEIL